MPQYDYKAKDATGAPIEGIVEANNENLASDLLRERGLRVESLDLRHVDALQLRFTFFQRVTPKDLVIFARQIAVMVSAAVALPKALRTSLHQTESEKLRTILSDVANEVEGGGRFSDALAKYPKVFNSFYVNMVRSGETTGKLDEVLLYLADQQERDYDMIGRVKGAMIYPIFVMILMAIIGTGMMIFVVPKLIDVFRESNVTLPITTRMLIATSDFFVHFWYLILGAVVVAVVGTRWSYGTPGGRRFFDAALLHVPVFGKLMRYLTITRLTQGLSTLIAGGVDVVTSLKVVAGIVDNEVYRALIMHTVQEVSTGSTIASVWHGNKDLPNMVVQMVSIGEETGQLQKVLERLTGFYTREVNSMVENLSRAVEPVIMVILGVAVGIMCAAIILPMYTLAEQM
jgi:type IV pilus assembly protein PilC